MRTLKLPFVDLEKRPLSYSSLKHFAKSPSHYRLRIMERKAPTPAMIFGKLADCLIITPENFNKEFAVAPPFDARTKEGKRIRDEFLAANGGKTVVSELDVERAKTMASKIHNHRIYKRMMQQVTGRQRTIRWTDKKTGIPCIAKLDFDGPGIIIDHKTDNDPTPDKWHLKALRMDYDIQVGMYIEGKKHRGEFPDFYFCVQETEPPYEMAWQKVPSDFQEYAEYRVRYLLDHFAACVENEEWDEGYEFFAPVDYYQLTLPGWLKHKMQA